MADGILSASLKALKIPGIWPMGGDQPRTGQGTKNDIIRERMKILVKTIVLWLLLPGLAQAGEPRQWEPILPLSKRTDLDPARVALGKALFFDARLSSDGTVSCATCHQMRYGGTDDKVPSQGAKGTIKGPTVFNTHFNIAQFWDGRALNLHDQLDGPVHNPREMNSSWPAIGRMLKADEAFRTRFLKAYPEGISEKTLKDALVTFEESLVTVDSPFDRWLKGDDRTLSNEQLEGYRLFKSYGCVACHQSAQPAGSASAAAEMMDRRFRLWLQLFLLIVVVGAAGLLLVGVGGVEGYSARARQMLDLRRTEVRLDRDLLRITAFQAQNYDALARDMRRIEELLDTPRTGVARGGRAGLPPLSCEVA